MMPKSFISKLDKRVIFHSGEQRKFLLKAVNKLKLSWSAFADKIGIHTRTLNDWKREKYSLPLSVLKKTCIITKLEIPVGIKIKDPFWYVFKGAKDGGSAVFKKYGRIGGDPEYRKKKWCEWWEKEGKNNPKLITAPKGIQEPNFSEELAEFVGIIIGDGGITKRQVVVTLNYKSEKPYSIFVKNLIKRLFKTEISIFYRREYSTISIIVSRTRLVAFCKSIGLKVGNKLEQNLDIPKWIKGKKNFEISCIRGLVDTDGCIFNECHKIKGRIYCYPRLSFTSHSRQLCFSAFKIFKKLGFVPKIRNKRNVQLENRRNIIRYFHLIGTNNLHHKNRFKLLLGGVGSGCPKQS